MSVDTALVGGDFKGNPYEEEGSRDPCKDGALEARCEVRVVRVQSETLIPQGTPTQPLHR